MARADASAPRRNSPSALAWKGKAGSLRQGPAWMIASHSAEPLSNSARSTRWRPLMRRSDAAGWVAVISRAHVGEPLAQAPPDRRCRSGPRGQDRYAGAASDTAVGQIENAGQIGAAHQRRDRAPAGRQHQALCLDELRRAAIERRAKQKRAAAIKPAGIPAGQQRWRPSADQARSAPRAAAVAPGSRPREIRSTRWRRSRRVEGRLSSRRSAADDGDIDAPALAGQGGAGQRWVGGLAAAGHESQEGFPELEAAAAAGKPGRMLEAAAQANRRGISPARRNRSKPAVGPGVLHANRQARL